MITIVFYYETNNIFAGLLRFCFIFLEFHNMKSDANGCARGALKVVPYAHVGESEDCGKYVGKLLERR